MALFFLISGFVIPFSLRDANRIGFLLGRSFRIFPTYAVGFTISLFAIFLSTYHYDLTWPFSFYEIFFHYIPGIRDTFNSRNIDGIIWTLDIEIKFYILCAIIAPLISRKSLLVFIAPLGLAVIGLILALFMNEWIGTRPRIYTSLIPLLFSSQYVVYMFAGTAMFYIHVGIISERKGILVALVMVLLFALMWALCPRVVPFDLMWNYVFAFLVFLFAFAFPQWFAANRVTNFFAKISYPLYVVHGVAGYAVLRMLLVNSIPATLALALVTFAAVIVSLIMHNFIEKPTQALSKKASGWRFGEAISPNDQNAVSPGNDVA